MPSEPFDIYPYRAALLEWHQEHVGQTQHIYWAQDSSTLLQSMTDDVLRCANLLYHRYAMAIDAAELSVIQRYFASGAQPATAWNHEDIQQLLRTLLHEKQELLAQYGRYQSVLGVWYDLMEWLNELLPGQSQRPPAKPEAWKRWNRSKRIDTGNRSKRFIGEPLIGGMPYHKSIWSNRRSSTSCVRMYSRIVASSLPTVET